MKRLAIAMAFFLATTSRFFRCSAFQRSAVKPLVLPSLYNPTTRIRPVSQGWIGNSRHLAHGATSSTVNKAIPMTLISGFLGSGKTSALKHLLENTEGVKLGIIVNDVAAVNIDAKLVASTNQGIIELKNGCACCSLADELLTSVEKLVQSQKQQLDAVVVELSGVSDPIAIKSNWNAARMSGHPVTKLVDVSRIVTVVDSCTFGTDWMTWDLAGERPGWVEEGDDCAGNRKVPELLAEQVEAADVIVINKIDLAGREQVQVASSLAQRLNDKATLHEAEFGRISPSQILGTIHDGASCEDPKCTDSSHSHEHHDHHEHTTTAVAAAAAVSSSTCHDPACTDPTHQHSHADEHASCADPDCTDPTHSHSHNHHNHRTTSTDQLNLVNFVYKASVPFHTRRLLEFLNQWPVPIKNELDLSLLRDAQEEGYEIRGRRSRTISPFVGVLRSKGFCWFAPTKWSGSNDDAWRHDTAMYWSHAGKHFGITAAGKWWGTLSKQQMKQYFDNNLEEYERILAQDFVSDEFGDRRQEIVFIGTNLNQEEITQALDECLCTEKEMKSYRQKLRNYMDTLLTTSPTAGLFNVDGTNHLDVKQ